MGWSPCSDPAQLPPVSNSDIFNTIPWVNFSILQLKEVVRAKNLILSSVLLKIRDGICDDQVTSVLKSLLMLHRLILVELLLFAQQEMKLKQ